MGRDKHAAVIGGGDPAGIGTFQPDGYVLDLRAIDATQVAVAHGVRVNVVHPFPPSPAWRSRSPRAPSAARPRQSPNPTRSRHP